MGACDSELIATFPRFRNSENMEIRLDTVAKPQIVSVPRWARRCRRGSWRKLSGYLNERSKAYQSSRNKWNYWNVWNHWNSYRGEDITEPQYSIERHGPNQS
jgi:hypothetical protein